MKHAYLIIAHDDFPQLQRLLTLLDDPRNDIFVHVDKKNQSFDPTRLHVERAGLHFVERMKVYWGDLSQVQVEYRLFAAARAQGSYAYYHLLSGADLPIKSQDTIHDFFAQHAGKDFISFWLFDSAHWDAHYKVSRYHFGMRYEKVFRQRWLNIASAKVRFLLSDLMKTLLGERKQVAGELVKGSTWLSATEETIDFLLSKQEEVLRCYRHTRCPDEIFLQTLIYNEPHFRDKIYKLGDEQGNLRFLIWPPATPSPQTLRLAHLPELLSSPCLFARKFSSQVDSEVSEELLRLLSPTRPLREQ